MLLAQSSESVSASWFRGRFRIGIIGGIVAVIIATGFILGYGHVAASGSQTETTVTVATVPVALGTVTKSEKYDGEFIANQKVDVHPEVAGFLKTILVDEGDRVQAGQVIATLEIPGLEEDISRAKAQCSHDQGMSAKAKATYEQLHTTYQRQQAVAAKRVNLISQQELDEAMAGDLSAEGAWQAAVSQQAIAKADLEKLLLYQHCCRITAPFAGMVTHRFVDPGALVQGGVEAGAQLTPLVTISQLDIVRLSFPITESVVPHLKIGQSISFRIGSLNEDKSGTITRCAERVDDATRTMEVQIDVPNPDLHIKPGMYASVTMETDRHKDVLTLPNEAIKRRSQSATVYLIGKDHRIEERPITLGIECPTSMEILSGVNAGDLVVFGNLENVKPDQLVDPIPFRQMDKLEKP